MQRPGLLVTGWVVVTLVLSTLYMLALARGDDALVVVHDPVACLDEAVLRLILKSGAVFDIRVGSRGHHLFEPYSLEEECALLRERIQSAMEKAAPP